MNSCYNYSNDWVISIWVGRKSRLPISLRAYISVRRICEEIHGRKFTEYSRIQVVKVKQTFSLEYMYICWSLLYIHPRFLININSNARNVEIVVNKVGLFQIESNCGTYDVPTYITMIYYLQSSFILFHLASRRYLHALLPQFRRDHFAAGRHVGR